MEYISAMMFYLVFTAFGILGYTITSFIFKDKLLSIATAKIVGLVIFGYIIWILCYLKLLNYQNILYIWLLLIVISVLAFGFCFNLIKPKLDKEFVILFVKIELVSIFLYVGYLFLRSFSPSANGTEHFMDMAMLTAAGKTDYFPFIDPWYAGKSVNYYYYGSYLTSLITNLADVPFSLSYNYMLGLIYSVSSLLIGSLAWTISKNKVLSAFSAFMVTSAGTLFYSGCVINSLISKSTAICSYASSTRLFSPSYIINEIPSYSFTVGNLHAHLLALPFFILGLVLIYNYSLFKKPSIFLTILIALSVATSGMINAWDAITLSSIFLLFIIIKSSKEAIVEKQISFKQILVHLLGFIMFTGLFMLPNLLKFQSPVLGLGFAPFYYIEHLEYFKDHEIGDVQYPTPFIAILGMWGIYIFGIVFSYITQKYVYKIKVNKDFIYLLSLFIVSIGIIIGVELFFVKDIYSIANPPYFRANTTFKFGFHAWTILTLLFAVFSSATVNYINNSLKISQIKLNIFKIASVTFCVAAIILGSVYTFEAINQYYIPKAEITLTNDSSNWMKIYLADDFATVNFINNNFQKRVVIAEAVNDSYTNGTRITSFTGMITPIGWPTHEWTWRFEGKAAEQAAVGENVETGWSAVSAIQNDINRLYSTNSDIEAKSIIEKYKIEYIYVGDLERTTYTDLNEEKFKQLGYIVFESGNSRLYKINY